MDVRHDKPWFADPALVAFVHPASYALRKVTGEVLDLDSFAAEEEVWPTRLLLLFPISLGVLEPIEVAHGSYGPFQRGTGNPVRQRRSLVQVKEVVVPGDIANS